ncbi:hypothetical protein MG293_000172 [Ovis ammon polii]|uniref:Uncharacterized protein n=1 Tax=Ovis ammon polii TaxID=230172 RepID=A0AAD4YHT6_OVIAM|nr:hypothetical protein MG293_000172 [Ovis ammon polii]
MGTVWARRLLPRTCGGRKRPCAKADVTVSDVSVSLEIQAIVIVVQALSRVRLFLTPWIGSSLHEFSRQEYWRGLPFPSPGDLPDPGIKSVSLTSPESAGTLKAVFFIFASLCAWYSGYLLAELIPDVHLSSAVYSIHSIGKKPILKAPTPKRQKCDHWSPCPADTYAYRLLSGGGRDKYAKICFEDEMDSGAWWAAVYGVAQSRTRLKRLSSSSSSNREPDIENRLMDMGRGEERIVIGYSLKLPPKSYSLQKDLVWKIQGDFRSQSTKLSFLRFIAGSH